MASSIFHTLSLILFHLLLASSTQTRTIREQTGFRATLTRVPTGQTLPKYTSANSLKSDPKASLIKSPMKTFKDVYTTTLSIGTPPFTFSAMMDTGSDLIGTKCKTSGSGSSFDTSKSTSFSTVDKTCLESGLGIDCIQKYADSNSVNVSLGQETLKIGKEVFKNVTFACGTPHGIPYNGIVGMGRGDLSLVSQLQQRVFSYCLGSRLDTKTSSVLLTGSKATSENINTQTTPLLKGNNKSFYYISLEGISVGQTKLPVTQSDFAMKSNGNGGMIIDSGTTFTYLDENIVNMISNEFLNQTKLEKSDDYKPYKGVEHCFKPPGNNANVPKMVFHFKGADWELLPDNYIYKQKGKNVACLAFIANNEKEDSNVSIFGNMMQQNMMVIYNLDTESLSFKRANCNKY